ncbi:alkylhydroperoxidase-related (seleno)protein [Microbacterium sp. X-17]|uniref:alkylhydroperoxidase-related (seleno)protein n=1 Tax=Microbacterium sp. X-17 TaxID=3144404 RepID=UPI0031F58F9E
MYPVREDLAEAIRSEWDRLSRAGRWWTGEERVAIAAEARESRNCRLCADRRAALTPYAVTGQHATSAIAAATLPPAVIDAIHRIATDSGRITDQWYQDVIAGGASEGQFVEAAGIIALVSTVDAFARGIGRAELALPAPAGGTPSRETPAGTEVNGTRVPTVAVEKADGDVASYYQQSLDVMGIVSNLQKALTLVPEEQFGFIELAFVMNFSFLTNEWLRSITRAQAELLAATVSAENDCYYCTMNHSTMLRETGLLANPSRDLIEVVKRDETAADALPAGPELRRFARAVLAAGRPGAAERSEAAAELDEARAALRAAVGEDGLIDAAAILASYNQCNLIADASGIQPEFFHLAAGAADATGDATLTLAQSMTERVR